jgi:hypothetical protein
VPKLQHLDLRVLTNRKPPVFFQVENATVSTLHSHSSKVATFFFSMSQRTTLMLKHLAHLKTLSLNFQGAPL